MSVMSVGQRPEANGETDEAGDPARPERPGHRLGGRKLPGREPCALSRLEREMRSSKPLARELRAHQRLAGELRARGSLARPPLWQEPNLQPPLCSACGKTLRLTAIISTSKARAFFIGYLSRKSYLS